VTGQEIRTIQAPFKMIPTFEERVLEHKDGHYMRISEDMAYKSHSMISPAMVRKFLLPSYCRWVSEIRNAGCPLADVDSDGYIAELIPLWIEAGINTCEPIEVAVSQVSGARCQVSKGQRVKDKG
jgi:uroporphyrinogen decarboxylase